MQAERQRQIDDGTPASIANAFLSCEECTLPAFERRLYRCGWIPESERIDEPMRPFAEFGATVCPGYTTTIPEVIEASRLLVWANRGELRSYVGERRLPAGAMDAIDILDGEVKAVEREILNRRRDEAGRGT